MKEGPFTCKSTFLIYLITCGDCGIQYVGQTVQCLHIRLNGHRSSVKNSLNTYVYQHFSCEGHDFSKIKIQIIDILNPQDHDKHDLDVLEDFWINTLETIYPFGLNDKIKGTGNISKICKTNNTKNINCYFSKTTERCRRGHGMKRKAKKNNNHPHIANNLRNVDHTINELSNLLKKQKDKLYIKIKSFSKKFINQILTPLARKENKIYSILTSYINNKFKPNNIQDKTKERENIILPFNCKFIDKLSFDSIIKDTSIQALLPIPIKDKQPLIIYYKYNSNIGKKLLNYNSFLKDLNNSTIKDIINNNCECATSPYKDAFHQHIVTGDLEIIANEDLKNIMCLGTKYREPNYLKPEEIKNTINKYIDTFIETKSRIYKIDIKDFANWKNKITGIVSNRINFYMYNKPDVFNCKISILKQNNIKDYIKELHHKFVIVVADKAANNFVIICKKFYILTIMKELGINTTSFVCTGNNTYMPEIKTEKQLILEHANYLKKDYNLNCGKKDKIIPRIFWNAKLHKTPSKARFISGARNCTTKKLSVNINKALQVIKASFGKYCDTIYRHTGINFNWSISSSYEFLDKIKSVEIYSMQVFDFTTLYTSLDLKEVENSLYNLIDMLFSNKNKFICISYDKAFFAQKRYNGHYYTFNKKSLKDAIKFYINNTYIRFGEYILKQTKGIPMGGNCSSPMADLTLGFREYSYMKQLLKNKKFNLAKLLSNNSRYVDDINIINYKHFKNISADIYTKDLQIERSGEDDKEINYLDIKITISVDGIITNVFNKTEQFTFPVVSFTHPDGNIPNKLGYNVFYGQVLRYTKICSTKYIFLDRTKNLFNLLSNRGYKDNKLIQSFKKVFNYNHFNLLKYGYDTTLQIVEDLKSLT